MLVLCFLFTKHKNQAHCLRKSIIQNAVIFPSWTSKMYLFTDPFWMIQGNVLITITTVCFPSSIEIYDNRLILLVTFMIWFFFKKVSFDLKSTNFEKTKQLLAFFPSTQTSLLTFTRVPLSLKANWQVWNWPEHWRRSKRKSSNNLAGHI